MNKQEFLAELRRRVYPLGELEVKKTLAYYGEMIDDRMEEGMTEAQAVEAMGPLEGISQEVLQDASLKSLIRARKPERVSAGMLTLLILGSPVWLPLIIAAVAVVLAAFVVVWSLIVSLWAVMISLAAAAVVCAFAVPFAGNVPNAIISLGVGLALAGVAILLYEPSKAVVRQAGCGCAVVCRYVKSLLIRKEG